MQHAVLKKINSLWSFVKFICGGTKTRCLKDSGRLGGLQIRSTDHTAGSCVRCMCNYPAALDVVVFLLQTLLDAGFIFVCDEDEAPPFLWLGVNGKLNCFNLKGEEGGDDFVKKLDLKKKKKKTKNPHHGWNVRLILSDSRNSLTELTVTAVQYDARTTSSAHFVVMQEIYIKETNEHGAEWTWHMGKTANTSPASQDKKSVYVKEGLPLSNGKVTGMKGLRRWSFYLNYRLN